MYIQLAYINESEGKKNYKIVNKKEILAKRNKREDIFKVTLKEMDSHAEIKTSYRKKENTSAQTYKPNSL